MKILMLGVFNPESTNISQAEAFERQGHEVVRYDYRDYRKVCGEYQAEATAIALCRQIEPDFVLFCKCSGVHINVVTECNRITKTALWYPDSMNANWNEELIEKIKYCRNVFCALEVPYQEALKLNDKSEFLQEGFDPLVDRFVHSIRLVNLVCFIGNLDEERKKFCEAVNATVLNNVSRNDHAKVVSESWINLNFTREGTGTSDRTYKILAAGGFLLTQPWKNMERDFLKGRDLATFNTISDLRKKIRYYLNPENTKEHYAIRQNGYNTVQKFSRDNWAKKIVERMST